MGQARQRTPVLTALRMNNTSALIPQGIPTITQMSQRQQRIKCTTIAINACTSHTTKVASKTVARKPINKLNKALLDMSIYKETKHADILQIAESEQNKK